MADAPVPTLVAMLLCDAVIQDVHTTKKSLVSIFTGVVATAFPTLINVTVFARLTDAEGKYKFRLDVVNLTENRAIFSMPTPSELEALDQLAFVELVMQVQGLPIPS